jgi:hypothetical protein
VLGQLLALCALFFCSLLFGLSFRCCFIVAVAVTAVGISVLARRWILALSMTS